MPSTNYLRPYILPEEMEVLISLLQEKHAKNNGLSRTEHAIFHKLSKLWGNSINGLTKPVVIERQLNKVERLELDGPLVKESGPLNPEQKREKAYHKWVNMPGLCSLDEIEMAQTHRFTHDLIDNREEFIKVGIMLQGDFFSIPQESKHYEKD